MINHIHKENQIPEWTLSQLWGRVAKNISLHGNLESLADISPEIEWFTGQLGLYKSILFTRNQFLSQEINSCHNKSFLVSSHPLVKLINLQQPVNPTNKFSCAYTFRGNLVPSEFTTLSYTLDPTHHILHIASYTLDPTHCILQITSYT